MRVKEVDPDFEVATSGETNALTGWRIVDDHIITGSLSASGQVEGNFVVGDDEDDEQHEEAAESSSHRREGPLSSEGKGSRLVEDINIIGYFGNLGVDDVIPLVLVLIFNDLILFLGL